MRANRDVARALGALAADAEQQPAWIAFARFCRDQERGLRREALGHLQDFLRDAETWAFEPRRAFVAWLAERIEYLGPEANGYPFLPHPLATRLFVPTLLEWAEREPAVARPHRWLALFGAPYLHAAVRAGLSRGPADAESHLRRAAALDPTEQPARLRLGALLIGQLEYAAHHLPEYYIGDPEADRVIAHDAARVIAELTDAASRERLDAELAAARQRLDDWIAWRASGAGDFAAWCEARGRAYAWPGHYYYQP